MHKTSISFGALIKTRRGWGTCLGLVLGLLVGFLFAFFFFSPESFSLLIAKVVVHLRNQSIQ